MRRRDMLMLGAATAALGATGLGLTRPASAQAKLALKASDVHPEGYPTVVAVENMGKKLEQATNGRISVQASLARSRGGLGVGLAIVKHIVELHAGTVVAESAGEGQGATFTVSLPIMAVRTQNGEETSEDVNSALLSESVSLRGLKVLVVDDEADTRDMLTRLLQERGAEVCTAASGIVALSLVQDCKPDMLIADIGMADMDGYEMMRRIRALPTVAGGGTPAVALTAFSRAEDRTRALLAGFQAHLIKPVESSELIATVAMLTRRIPLQAGSAAEKPGQMQAGETT